VFKMQWPPEPQFDLKPCCKQIWKFKIIIQAYLIAVRISLQCSFVPAEKNGYF
jgi:hypothetical protein